MLSTPSSIADTVHTSVGHDPTIPGAMSEDSSLIDAARDEVDTIRSSLHRRSTFDVAQVTRHSHRLSQLIGAGQDGLSEVLPLALVSKSQPDFKTHKYTSLLSLKVSVKSSDFDNEADAKQDPQYLAFKRWILQRPVDDRHLILAALSDEVVASPPSRLKCETMRIHLPDVNTANAIDKYEPEPSTQITIARSPVDIAKRTPATAILELIEEQRAHQYYKFSRLSFGSSLQLPNPDIDLSHQEIKCLDVEVADLLNNIQAHGLSLGSNVLKTLPGNLSLCTHLRLLDLSHNSFDTIPAAVLQLDHLEALDMRHNALKLIPSGVSRMRQLKVLCLVENRIQGIPFEISRMVNLEVLDCVGNPIVFPSPHRINLKRRFRLSLDGHHAQGTFNANRTKMLKVYLQRFNMEDLTYIDGRLPNTLVRSPSCIVIGLTNTVQAVFGKLSPKTLQKTINHLKKKPSRQRPRSPQLTGISEIRASASNSSDSDTPGHTPFVQDAPNVLTPAEGSKTSVPNGTLEVPRLVLPRAKSSTKLSARNKRGTSDHRRSRSHDGSSRVAAISASRQEPTNPKTPLHIESDDSATPVSQSSARNVDVAIFRDPRCADERPFNRQDTARRNNQLSISFNAFMPQRRSPDTLQSCVRDTTPVEQDT